MASVRLLRAISFGLALAAASPAYAEWHITPTLGITMAAHTNGAGLEPAPIGKHVNFGGAVALLGGGIFGAEGVVVFAPGFHGVNPESTTPASIQSSRIFAVMGNGVVTLPRKMTEYFLRPYFSGGIGYMRLKAVDASNQPAFDENFPAMNIGGGAVGFFTQHTGVRFDLRYFRRLGETNSGPAGFIALDHPEVSFMSLSVGVVFRR